MTQNCLLHPGKKNDIGLLQSSSVLTLHVTMLHHQIKMPHDFQEWYATMSSQFESRFGRLFRGPMWSGCERDDIKNPLVVSKDTLYYFIERKGNQLNEKWEICNSMLQ